MNIHRDSLKKVVRPLVLSLALAAVCSGFAQVSPEARSQDDVKKIQDAIHLYKIGKVDESQSAFEAIRTAHPTDVDANSWLGFIYLQKGRAADALPMLKAAHDARPADLDIEINLANAYMATDDDGNAGTLFADIVSKQPDKASGHYNLGTICLRQKKYDQATAELRKAIAISKEDPYAYNNLGVAEDSQNATADACDAFEHASDLRPNNLGFARNAGMTAARAGRWADADKYLSRAHDLDSSDAKITVALGEAKLRTNNRAAARTLYEAAAAAGSEDASVWYNVGVLRAEAGDRAGAEEAYRKAMSMNDSDLDTLGNLGTLLYKKGDYAGATQCFDKLAGLSNSISAKRNLAAACAMSGDMPRATKLWKEILVDSPNDTGIRLLVANAEWKSGDFDAAHQHYAEILHSDTHNADALNGVGLWQLKHDDYRGASVSFRAAIGSNPGLVSAYNNLAICLEKLNRKAEAIALLKKAAKIDPNADEVQKNLRRMQSAS